MDKIKYEKICVEIIGLAKTEERIIEIVLKDSRVVKVRRDLIEIYGNRAFIPRWLADKL